MTRNRVALAVAAAVLLSSAAILGAEGDNSGLDRLKNAEMTIIVNWKDSPVSTILKAAAGAGSFTLTFDDTFTECRLSLPKQEITIKNLLIELAGQCRLEYSVPDRAELVVGTSDE